MTVGSSPTNTHGT